MIQSKKTPAKKKTAKGKRAKPPKPPVRIYSFYCKPVSIPPEFDVQLKKSREYYNARVEIELDARGQFRSTRSASNEQNLAVLENQIKEASDQIDAIQERVSKARQKANAVAKAKAEAEGKAFKPTRVQTTKEDAQRLKELKALRAKLLEKAAEARAAIKEMMLPAQEEMDRRVEAKLKKLGKTGPTIRALVIPEAFAEMEKEDWPDLWKEVKRLELDKEARVRKARGASDLYSGNYLMIDDSTKQWNQYDPKVKRWDHCGRVGVHVSGGLDTEEMFNGTSKLIQIDPLPPDTWDTRSGRRHAQTLVKIRVDSTETGAPVFAIFRATLHRRVPEGTLKKAWIKVSRIGNRTEYALQLSIQSEGFRIIPRGYGTMAISLGWRSSPGNKIQVGCGVDEKGQVQTFALPWEIISGLRYSDDAEVTAQNEPSLRTIGDEIFNGIRTFLTEWLETDQVPEWIRAWIQTNTQSPISQWRSRRRMSYLVGDWVYKSSLFQDGPNVGDLWQSWKKHRGVFKGSETKDDLFCDWAEFSSWLDTQNVTDPTKKVVLYLEWWRRKNRHIYQWECDQRAKSRARRKDFYRNIAASLRKEYDVIVVDNKRAFAEKALRPSADAETGAVQASQRLRVLASVSEFLEALQSALGKDRCIQSDLKGTCDEESARNLLNNYLSGRTSKKAAE